MEKARTSIYQAAAAFFGGGGKEYVEKETIDLGSQRRFLPVQAGSKADRSDADALSRLETESAEHVIEAGLWKYHRLIPPPQDSPRYYRFQLMLEYLLIYTSFWMPLRVAFFGHLHSPGWVAVDVISYMIDVCFWSDILLTLRTAYYDHNSELVTDANAIVYRYLQFWFWVDTIATFPWDLATGIFDLKIIRLARALRLFKKSRKAYGASVVVALLRIIVRCVPAH